MEQAMTMLRELRELNKDYQYLVSQSGYYTREKYSKMYQELSRRIANLREQLATHLDYV
jgi:ElaB/YqjD/DUF883 family membrane-anchored ribosome-binding protein